MESTFRRVSLAHSPPPWAKSGALFFVTICCEKRGANQLCNEMTASALFDAAAVYASKQKWHPKLFLLMPDHCHALISFPIDSSMSEVIGNWKRFTSRTSGIEWQRNFFDHRIRNDESWEEKAAYIRLNPVRNKLVAKASDWPWVLESR